MSELRAMFMASLAKLVQPDNPEEAARVLSEILPMLSREPDRCFTSRTCLEAVCRTKRRTVIPGYADISNAMQQWQRDNPLPAIASDSPAAALAPEDRMWVDYFYRRQGEGFAATRERDRPSSREHVLSLVRSQSQPAWELLTGYVREQSQRQPTAEEKAAVARTLGGLADDIVDAEPVPQHARRTFAHAAEDAA